MSTPSAPLEPAPKPAMGALVAKLLIVVAAIALGGYFVWQQLKPKSAYEFNPATFAFVDQAESNAPLEGVDIGSLQFQNVEGKPVDLKQFHGKKNVALVVTRGNTSGKGKSPYFGNICLYCSTQTSRLVANYPAFQNHDCEVVVVFPIQKPTDGGAMGQFKEAMRHDGTKDEPPFPLVLDVELRAVDQLGIRADLSKPATYILDKQGQVRFAYVGLTVADRPSVQSLLDQLATINADAK